MVPSRQRSRTLSDEKITLEFLAEQNRRMQADLRMLIDDNQVSAAILRRLDNTVSALVDEIRAVHAQQNRTAARLRALEEHTGE